MKRKYFLISAIFLFFPPIDTQDKVMILYKIVSPEHWQLSKNKDELVLSSDDKAYIHFSTSEQLPRIIEKYWHNKPYIILTIDAHQLPGELIFEPNRPGGDSYWHLYNGHIPHVAIVSVKE